MLCFIPFTAENRLLIQLCALHNPQLSLTRVSIFLCRSLLDVLTKCLFCLLPSNIMHSFFREMRSERSYLALVSGGTEFFAGIY